MNTSFWKLGLGLCGLLLCNNSVVAARKKKAKVVAAVVRAVQHVAAQANASNASPAAAPVPVCAVTHVPVAPPRPPRPARPFLVEQRQQVKPAGSVRPLPPQPVASAVVQNRDWAAGEKRREALKAEVNEARSDVASLSVKFQAYIKREGGNPSKANLEKMKGELSRQGGIDLKSYEDICLAMGANGSDPHEALMCTVCYLLAWQYASKLKTYDGHINMREIVQRLHSQFEIEDAFVRIYSNDNCRTIATYVFTLIVESLTSEEIAAIPAVDKGNVLAPFLYRRPDEPVLETIRMDLGPGIPEINLAQAERALTSLIAAQVNVADIEILKYSLTVDEESELAFERMCAAQAKGEVACSRREIDAFDAFAHKYCSQGRGQELRKKLQSMRKQAMQRKACAEQWRTSSEEKAKTLVTSLEPAYRSKYQPSIFTPVAKFFHNRYVHYTGFAILGVLAGVYGYWMYRKIVPAKLPQFI